MEKYDYQQYLNDKRSSCSRDRDSQQLVMVNGKPHKIVPLRSKSNSKSPDTHSQFLGSNKMFNTHSAMDVTMNSRGTFPVVQKTPVSNLQLEKNSQSEVESRNSYKRVSNSKSSQKHQVYQRPLGTIKEQTHDNSLSQRGSGRRNEYETQQEHMQLVNQRHGS